jgi:hypothetical protein
MARPEFEPPTGKNLLDQESREKLPELYSREEQGLDALGVMLYELTTGQLPFQAENPFAIITQHLHAPPVSPKDHREDLPGFLNNLILKLLEKEPDKRFESAALVLELLEAPQKAGAELRTSKELTGLDRIVRGRIVGRQSEYQKARTLWRKATTGQGQTLLISGEPGIGKTRLMREVITQAEVGGGQAYIGEAYAESNTLYGTFTQITRAAFKRNPNIVQELPQTVLADILKLAPTLKYKYPDIEPNPHLDPESEQALLLENMVTFFEVLSGNSPLLIVLEDVHWADSGTLSMFHHLIRRTQDQPIMFLASYRAIELREAQPFNNLLLELNRQRIGERSKLERLSKEQARLMLTAIFQEDITDDFLTGIYQETEGNPFFIEEICRALVESGKLRFEDGEWQCPSIEELEIPRGIQVANESRLYKLAEQVQGTLRMAAVIGREFEFDILLQALELDEDALIDALESAEDAQMIQELGGRGAIAVRTNPAVYLALAQEGLQAVQGLKEGPGLAHLLAANQQWDDAWAEYDQTLELPFLGSTPGSRRTPSNNGQRPIWRVARLKISPTQELLEEALAIFADIGATGYVDKVEAQLEELA